MFYRSGKLLPSSYSLQLRVIRNPEDRVLAVVAVLLCVVALPLVGSQYVLSALLIPLLILSIAAMGLNLLMGYAGQASLGSGAFMAVGAYTSFKLATTVPQIPVVCDFFLGGLLAALIGILSGCPACGCERFTWRSRPWRRNFSFNGCSPRCLGSGTTLRPAWSPRRHSRFSGFLSTPLSGGTI